MNYEFSSKDIVLFIVLIAIVISVIVILLKYYLNNRRNLKEKHASALSTSPHYARYKYPEVDVFRYRRPILLFGMSIAIGLVFIVLNWTVFDRIVDYSKYDLDVNAVDFEVIPRTIQKKKKKPTPVVIEEIVVENEIEEDSIEFESMEIGIDEAIEVPEMDTVLLSNAPLPPPKRKEEADVIFSIVEEMPRFPGCEDIANKDERIKCSHGKLYDFIYKNLSYPTLARETGIEGKVILKFAVDKKGKVSKIKILRDIGGGCGQAASEAVERMKSQNWTPGRQGGRKVSVWFTLPVVFKLAG